MAQTKVLMVVPRFSSGSFWNYGKTCELVGAKYPAAPLGLITVAAMLPKDWDIRLVDRNTDDLTDADIAWADMVMTGGMLPQQFDTVSLMERVQKAGRPIVIGGPDATSSPAAYAAADFLVLGEAEGILDRFVAAWQAGERTGRFEAEKFQADVTTTPTPRFDLLKLKDYMHVGVQFSRGCPFTCEFCDIIELYGRKPRTKTTAQMLTELDAVLALGYRGHVDFVDDNLVGNKKALKAFLPELVAWQKRNGYPFEFSTEASINLADDPELLEMMRQANFFALFVGIESPDPETLRQMQKKQNTRRSIPDSIHKLYGAGMFVTAGFIVGFDNEKDGVGDGIVQLIEDSAIPVAMVGLLYALPNTQLTRRLEKEGRLHPTHDVDSGGVEADQCTAGLNFDTLRPRRDTLVDFREVVERTYTPEAYFGRVRQSGRALVIKAPGGKIALRDLPRDLGRFLWLAIGLSRGSSEVRWQFWKTVLDTALHNPKALKPVISMMGLYAHLGPFSQFVLERISLQIADLDEGRWQRPEPIEAERAVETAAA
ncbi:MAG: B12-binding domain-containing radical SAM protein [Alsobacter sp.]